MKKAVSTLLFVLAGLAASVWFVLTLSEREQRAPASKLQQAEQRVEDSPYPAGLWQELGGLGRRIRISHHAESELPPDIPWQNGSDTKPLGDPEAEKGGTLRLSACGPFPAHFLAFGSPSPQFFHYSLFERIDMPLVQRHPETGGTLPALADAWHTDGKTVWFRLDPRAHYSNGKRVRAGDFALGILLRSKCKHGTDTEQMAQAVSSVRFYGESIIAVELRQPCPVALLLASSLLHPAEPGFYAEFGNDYTERYAQRIPPTTGAYTVSRVEKGRLIRLEKVPNWWAADLPHRRHTCNVDAIEHHYLRDEAQAWELLLRGELDMLQTRDITTWQQRLAAEPALQDGRITPHTFPVEYPLPPYGIAVNAATIPHVTMRRGILHALDMDKAIEVMFRGEGERLTSFSSGYGALSPSRVPRYGYRPDLARNCFATEGFTQHGKDGILRRKDGSKLSFRLTYTPSAKTDTLVSILAQSAKACGMELVPDAEPWQNIDNMNRESSTELLFWAAAPSTLMPQPEHFLHSSATGADAPFHLNSPEMDAALMRCRTATSLPALAAACAEVDEWVYKLAVWLPAWKENRAYVAAWNHVRLPEPYSGPYDVAEGHTLWLRRKP